MQRPRSGLTSRSAPEAQRGPERFVSRLRVGSSAALTKRRHARCPPHDQRSPPQHPTRSLARRAEFRDVTMPAETRAKNSTSMLYQVVQHGASLDS